MHGDPRFDGLVQRLGLNPDSKSVSTVRKQSKKTMLAVLPFTNLSGDPEQEYFSDGMTEEMITRLGRLRPELLGVIARTSAMRYKQTDKPIDQIGRELGVAYVIEGGVRRAGNSVRINAQLIQVSDQTQLWGDSYTRDLSDVFAVQAEVAEAIAESLAVKLLPQQQIARSKAPTESSAAYDAYLLGRNYWAKRTPESLYTAIDHFKRAIGLDANYALAYSGLADAWGVLPFYVPGPYSEMNAEAMKAAERALALDPSLAEAHVSIALVLGNMGDRTAGNEHYRKALEIDPNIATAHQWYGQVLATDGQFEEAIDEFEKAIALDPLAAVMRLDYGLCMRLARRWEEAGEQLNKALDLQPDLRNAATELMWVHLGMGDHAAAAASFENNLTLLGQPASHIATFRQTYQSSGLKRALVDWLELFRSEDSIPHSPAEHAGYLAWCGENDRALKWLERAVQEQDPVISLVKYSRAYDNLRDDPRYDELLRRIGREPTAKPRSDTEPPNQKTRLAILPLTDNSPKPQAWLASGLADAISTRLGRVSASKLGVLGPETTTYYAQPGKSIKDLCQGLNVDFVLRGSIQNIGNDVRITANLIHADDLTSIWSDEFKGTLDDPFALQSMVAEKIIAGLPFELTGEEQARFKNRYTANPKAELAYMQGHFFGPYNSVENLSRAVSYYERAIEIDPEYALAYCGLVNAKCGLAAWGALRTPEIRSEMEETVARALALDDTLAEAYVSAGVVATWLNWDWPAAETAFERAIELNPNIADVHHQYGYLLVYVGRYDDAIRRYEQAIELNPVSSTYRSSLGMLYAGLGRLNEAEQLFQKAFEFGDDNGDASFWLADVRQKQERFDDAVEIMERAVLSKDQPELASLCFLGNAYAMAGRMDDARKQLAEMHKLKGEMRGHYMWFGELHAALGEKDEAFRWLEQALAEREAWLPHLRFDPGLIHIRSDPRFAELHRKMGLGHVALTVPTTAP
jgi:TolB-like protein/Tfp pilus assembly protein PilF